MSTFRVFSFWTKFWNSNYTRFLFNVTNLTRQSVREKWEEGDCEQMVLRPRQPPPRLDPQPRKLFSESIFNKMQIAKLCAHVEMSTCNVFTWKCQRCKQEQEWVAEVPGQDRREGRVRGQWHQHPPPCGISVILIWSDLISRAHLRRLARSLIAPVWFYFGFQFSSLCLMVLKLMRILCAFPPQAEFKFINSFKHTTIQLQESLVIQSEYFIKWHH